MIDKILKDIGDNCFVSGKELTYIKEQIEKAGIFFYENGYSIGFDDGLKSSKIAEIYYKGFSYGKKEDQ